MDDDMLCFTNIVNSELASLRLIKLNVIAHPEYND